jgi:glycosyltransferase involved in cell wall biosynthesis
MNKPMDRLICGARRQWYNLYEPIKLGAAREEYRQQRGRVAWESADSIYGAIRPVVTIIIPTHNRSKLLVGRALKSVQRQSYPYWRAIVAAHGCTDDTEERVMRFGDYRVSCLKVPRRQTYPQTAENHWFAGPVAPINAALSISSGEWIARIDDDDTWTPDHLASLLSFARDGNYEFVSGAHATHEGKVAPYDLAGVKVGGTQTWLYRSYLKFFRYNPDCYRKKVDRVNDTDIQDRFRRAGVRMGYLDKVVAHVLPRPGESDVGLKAYQRNSDEMAF